MPRIVSIIFLILTFFSASAQTPDDFRTEQVFIAPDRTTYGLTDTVRVNGFVTCMAHDNIRPYSRYVYLELINSDDSVLVRNKLRLGDNGDFYSAIPIDRIYKKGTYFLRGYTRFMENFSHDSFGISPILLGQSLPLSDSIIDDRIALNTIIPGNRLIAGTPQLVSCFLTTYAGFPIPNKTLSISDNEGNITSLSNTSTSGYAHFIFVPKEGKEYKLLFSDSGISKAIDLPSSVGDTPVINAVAKRNHLMFDITGKMPEHPNLYLFEKGNGLKKITLSGQSGSLQFPNQPIGPITLFLTDGENNTISEISVLPDLWHPTHVEQPCTLTRNTAIKLDTWFPAHNSSKTIVRIVPENDIWISSAYSSILFSDLTSTIPMPGVSQHESEFRKDVEAWLKSASFVRFNIKDVVNSESLFSYKILPEAVMVLKGTIYDDVNAKHPMNKGSVVAYNNYDRLPFDTEVDSKGRFSVQVSDFPDGTEFFLQGINNKGVIKSTIITLDSDTFPQVHGFSILKPFSRNRYSIGETAISGEGNAGLRELPDVVIKARTLREEIPNDKIFHGVRFKSREQIEEHQYNTLKEIIRDMPFVGLRLVKIEYKELQEENESSYTYDRFKKYEKIKSI